MNLDQILARMGEVRDQIETLAAVDGDLDEAQRSDWDALNAEWDELDGKRAQLVERAERLDAIRNATIERSTGDGAAAAGVTREFQVTRTTPDVHDLDAVRSQFGEGTRQYGQTLRDHVMRSLESWDSSFAPEQLGQVEEHVRSAHQSRNAQKIAEHVLRTSHPDYLSAFEKITAGGANPQIGLAMLEPDERAALAEVQRAAVNEGTTTQGGFLVPPMLDPTIISTRTPDNNPFRGISTIKTITTQTWKGVTSAGVSAEWTAEAAEVADASPTFGQPSITPVRADAYVQASIEVIQDTGFSAEIAGLMAEARDALEATAFATGTGSTQPYGIVTELTLVTASRVAGSSGAAGAADFVVGDIYAVDNDLPARHRANASWMANKVIYNKIRRFGEGSNGSNAAFWTDLGGGRPPVLIGYNAYESSAMDSTIVSGSNDDVLILGDFRKYYIVDRVGLELVYEPLVKGSNRRPTGEVGWVAFWRVGARTVDANAFRMLRL